MSDILWPESPVHLSTLWAMHTTWGKFDPMALSDWRGCFLLLSKLWERAAFRRDLTA